MPRASERTATAVKTGDFLRVRSANRRSFQKVPISCLDCWPSPCWHTPATVDYWRSEERLRGAAKSFAEELVLRHALAALQGFPPCGQDKPLLFQKSLKLGIQHRQHVGLTQRARTADLREDLRR